MRSRTLVPLLLIALLILPVIANADLQDCLLDYDSDFKRFDPACGVKPFTNIFDLYVTPELAAAWSEQDFIDFMNAVIDSNTATYVDAFPRLWDYFCIGDQEAAWDSIRYSLGGAPMDSIAIYLVANNSVTWSHANATSMTFKVLDTYADPDTIVAPRTLALSRGFCHEFSHTIEGINRGGILESWQTEMLACGAEYFSNGPQLEVEGGIYFDPSYESFYHNDGALTPNYAPYSNYRLFYGYLFANHRGSPSTDTDDVIYRWVRANGSTAPVDEYSTFDGLSTALDGDSTVAGEDGDEKAGTLFHRAAMAAYIDRGDTLDGRFGYGDGEAYSPRVAHMFEWLSPTGLRMRTAPPTFAVGEAQLTPTTISEFEDTLDSLKTSYCRTKPLGVRKWGMDYLVFTADPDYFATHPDTLLMVKLKGLNPWPEGMRLRAGYVTYGSADDPMWDNPIREIEEVAPVAEVEDTIRVEFCVEDFGSTVKSVVVMLSLVTDPINANEGRGPDWAITCWSEEGETPPDVPYALTYGYAEREVRVPLDESELQDGINRAIAGQTVRVSKDIAPYSAVTMKRGVKVEKAFGPYIPEIVAADSVVVDFPSDADERSALIGFLVKGGTGTDAVVRLRGEGRVVDCDIRAGTGQPEQGVLVEGGTGEVLDTRVIMDATGYTAKGIEVQDASPVIDGCEVRARNGYSPSTGILVDGGAPEIHGCYVTAMDHGIWVSGGTSVVGCTVDSTTKEGIVANSSAVVENSIVSNVVLGSTHNGILGTTVRYCIAPDGISATTEEGNSLDDPLYCSPVAHTLRVDSYGAPDNNDSGNLIGAYGVACIGDTLQRNSTVRSADLDVLSDIVVPTGKTLSIEPGGGLTFPEDAKLQVNGDLEVIGGAGSPVVLQGTLAQAGSWGGIVVGGDGTAHVELENAEVKYAVNSITHGGGPTADLISLRNVTLTSFENAGLWLGPDWADSVGLVEFDSVTVTMKNAPYGLWVDRTGANESYDVAFRSVIVSGRDNQSQNEYGIFLNTTGTDGNHSPVLHDVWVLNVPAGVGLVLVDTSPTIDSLYVVNCKTGIEMWSGGEPTITMDRAGGYGIFNATTGIYIGDDVQANVSDFQISDATTGVFSDGYSGSSFSDGEILGGTTGFKTQTLAGPSIQDQLRRVRVKNFATYGVWSKDATCVNLGTTSDSGDNEIYADTTVSPSRYVAVKYCIGSTMLMAEDNWWGPDSLLSPSMFAACVDWDPYLTTPPLDMDRARGFSVGIVEGPSVRLLRNPAVAVVDLDVTTWAVGGGEARIDVYDVTGRLVRHLSDGGLSRGSTRIRWDGADERGRAVPSGIYFLRVDLPDYRAARRVVLVH